MARSAKQRKWDKNKARKQQAVAKTAASRERRLSNKHTRNEIHEVNRKAGQRHIDVIMVDQVPHERITATDDTGKEVTIVGGKIELINGIYRVINKQHVVLNNAPKLSDLITVNELDDEGIEATVKFCNQPAEDEHAAAEELAKYATGEITAVEPAEEPIRIGIRNDVASKSRFERLKDKIRGN